MSKRNRLSRDQKRKAKVANRVAKHPLVVGTLTTAKRGQVVVGVDRDHRPAKPFSQPTALILLAFDPKARARPILADTDINAR